MTAAQVASWIMEPCNGSARPAKGERLWLLVARSEGAPRVVAWTSSTEAPAESGWLAIDWRPEWDQVCVGAGPRTVADVARSLAAEVQSALSTRGAA